MSSEKHFSPPERQEYFFDIQPPGSVATFLLQRAGIAAAGSSQVIQLRESAMNPKEKEEEALQRCLEQWKMNATDWMSQFIETKDFRTAIGEERYRKVLEDMELFALQHQLGILEQAADHFKAVIEKQKKQYNPKMFKSSTNALEFSVYVQLRMMHALETQHVEMCRRC